MVANKPRPSELFIICIYTIFPTQAQVFRPRAQGGGSLAAIIVLFQFNDRHTYLTAWGVGLWTAPLSSGAKNLFLHRKDRINANYEAV